MAVYGLETTRTQERFWSKVVITTPDECWMWTPPPMSTGYGQFRVKPKTLLAHRVAFEITKGAIPPGMIIDHRCRNRRCVNPGHLQAVSAKANAENLGGAQRNSASGIRGVHWLKTCGKWRAIVVHNYETHRAGYFDSIEDAEAAAIALRNRLFSNNLADREDFPVDHNPEEGARIDH